MSSKLCIVILLSLLSIHIVSSNPQKRDVVSNQEIRDAILSLVHSYSLLDNKLERHEQRERALGELVKKGLLQLQKNQRMFEPMKGTYSRIDERVSQIETLLINQEQRLSLHQTELAGALDGVLKWMGEHKANFAAVEKRKNVDTEGSAEEDDDVSKKIDDLSDNIKGLRIQIAEIKADRESTDETNKNLLAQSERLVNSKLASADEVISRLEEKLSHFYVTGPLSTPNPRDNEWESNVAASLLEIKSNLKSTCEPPADKELSISKEFLQGLTNDTLEAIEDMKLEVLIASDKSFSKTATRIKETNEALEGSINEVLKTVTDTQSASETFYETSKKSYETLKSDVLSLANLEKISLQTSENVLDTKRRVEYGVHQILLEVSDVIKLSVKELNTTLHSRFDDIDVTILENHHGSLANLSSKIETEMSQVWRQIGIMYQEISSSKQALDRLQQQTEIYVNGTLSTMDGMEGKVTMITDRINEVDSNLNYLMGRLSLVTQQFNQIRSGLGDVLDNIRSGFKEVEKEMKDMGPGPHKIPPTRDEEDII